MVQSEHVRTFFDSTQSIIVPLVVEVGQDQAQISLSLQNEMVVVLVDIISTTSLTEDDIDLQQQNKSDGGDGGWEGERVSSWARQSPGE